MKYTFLAFLSSFILLSSAFSQGSLTPPGAPAPTMKSLDQIASHGIPLNSANTPGDANNHFIISQPGSYYLTGNLAVSETNAIRVAAAGVTIDLNGFQISRASGTGGDAFTILAASHNCTIKNGTINGFLDGVDSITVTPRSCIFQNLTVTNCTGIGLRAGEGAMLENCSVHDCSGIAGIITGDGATMLNCTANRNTATSGIQAGNASSLSNCSVSNNNGTNGILASSDAALINCGAYNNTETNAGISASAASVLTNCTASGNLAVYGFDIGNGSIVTGCNASFNSSSATSSAGFHSFGGSVFTNCNAHNGESTAATLTKTTGMGFDIGGSLSKIEGCKASINAGDGFRISGLVSTILRNMSSENLQGNGFEVTGTGNFLAGNMANGNVGTGGNYSIAASNAFGPLVVIAGVGDISGTPNANHPWANFSY